jgi:hypothetical protein
MSADTPQFADFTWPSRWNKSQGGVAGLSQSGAEVYAVNFMGVIRFRLDDAESVAAIVSRARVFADMVERAKREFDEGARFVEQRIEEVELLRCWSAGLDI